MILFTDICHFIMKTWLWKHNFIYILYTYIWYQKRYIKLIHFRLLNGNEKFRTAVNIAGRFSDGVGGVWVWCGWCMAGASVLLDCQFSYLRPKNGLGFQLFNKDINCTYYWRFLQMKFPRHFLMNIIIPDIHTSFRSSGYIHKLQMS